LLVARDGRVLRIKYERRGPAERDDSPYLSSVNEFSQRNVCVVAECMEVFEVLSGSILEFNSEEIAEVWGRSSSELDSDSGSIVG
jgi:hypothetical protein